MDQSLLIKMNLRIKQFFYYVQPVPTVTPNLREGPTSNSDELELPEHANLDCTETLNLQRLNRELNF